MRLLSLLLAFACLPAPVYSAPSEADDARMIQIESDRLEARNDSRRVTFIGNVVARHADMVIYADQLAVAYGPEQKNVEEVLASGNVRIVRGDQIATSDKARFNGVDQTIWLTGSPKVRQGQSFIEGSEITIFLREGRSLVKSEDGTRVNAFFSTPPAGETKP